MSLSTKPCSIDGCPRPVRARGWCTTHYARWGKHGDPIGNGDRVVAPPTCTISGCENPHKARGFCPKHWEKWHRYGDPLHVRPKRTCDVDGCDRPHAAHGWCVVHYNRWLSHGDPTKLVLQKQTANCEAPDCDKPSPSMRYCSMHNERLKRNGHLGTQVRTRHLHQMGYVKIKASDHPLADSKGWAYEHRVVLYAEIGPGVHPCNWCGMSVSWDRSYPAHADALVVDHVDENRGNNDPSNLVPSCSVCNFQRSNPLEKRYGKATA